MKASCDTCKYGYKPVMANVDVPRLFCRRYPPTLQSALVGMREPTMAGGQPTPVYDHVCSFPTVAEKTWCGEWQQKILTPSDGDT